MKFIKSKKIYSYLIIIFIFISIFNIINTSKFNINRKGEIKSDILFQFTDQTLDLPDNNTIFTKPQLKLRKKKYLISNETKLNKTITKDNVNNYNDNMINDLIIDNASVPMILQPEAEIEITKNITARKTEKKMIESLRKLTHELNKLNNSTKYEIKENNNKTSK